MSTINLPTNAERERLVLLMEECAEVIQIASKILRHGYESSHPDNPCWPNKSLLAAEIGHMEFARDLIVANKDVDSVEILNAKLKKRQKVWQYLHFQKRVEQA